MVALPAIATGHVANASGGVHQHISPELDPESHKKFFEKDYPDDKRPAASSEHHKFDFKHPYPIVQDSEDFDKDYVKDENSDGGEWKAQMDYDSLRNKIREQARKVEEAKKKMDEEKKEWLDAKKDEDNAENKSEHAEGSAEKAKTELEDAQDKLKNADGAIGDAVGDVEKEMKDLEKCKKALEEARARLKKLLEEKVKRETVERKIVAEETDAEKQAGALAKDSKEGAKAGGKYDSTVEKERAEHLAARKAYEKELQDVKDTEKALDEAARKLREFRHSGVDKDGGVYYEKSGSARAVLPAALALVLGSLASLAFSEHASFFF